MTLQLMIIHHHTKVCYKKLSSSEDNFSTKPAHMDLQTHSEFSISPPPPHPNVTRCIITVNSPIAKYHLYPAHLLSQDCRYLQPP